MGFGADVRNLNLVRDNTNRECYRLTLGNKDGYKKVCPKFINRVRNQLFFITRKKKNKQKQLLRGSSLDDNNNLQNEQQNMIVDFKKANIKGNNTHCEMGTI